MKFIVNVKEVHNLPFLIEASTHDDAIAIVKGQIAEGSANFDILEYSHTLDSKMWDVVKQDQ